MYLQVPRCCTDNHTNINDVAYTYEYITMGSIVLCIRVLIKIAALFLIPDWTFTKIIVKTQINNINMDSMQISTSMCLLSNSYYYAIQTSIKGQLISKGLFDVIIWTKKKQRNLLRISALGSKQWSDQKNKGTLCH